MKPVDYIALSLLVGQYFIYQFFYEYISDRYFGKTRESIIARYRMHWLNVVLESEQPLLGIQTIRNLEMVHTFLITLVMIMLGGITSVFSTNLNWINDLADGTYLEFLAKHTVAIKLLTAIGFLMVALFHFIFGLRICFNMNFTVAGARKSCSQPIKNFINNQVKRQARHFILGVRAMYYSLFPLIWIVDVWAMILLSIFITYLFYRFDYTSIPDLKPVDMENGSAVQNE